MALTLRLTASIYDQAQSDDVNPATKRYVRGDVFEARNQDEYDRLVNAGAAVDPDKELADESAKLEARQAQLQQELASLESRRIALASAPAPAPSELTGADLDAALDDAGLLEGNKSKSADEKRQILADAQG
jgi:hypothetical protein